jgi:hypothetical protein
MSIHSIRAVSLMSAGWPVFSASFSQEHQVLEVRAAGASAARRERRDELDTVVNLRHAD